MTATLTPSPFATLKPVRTYRWVVRFDTTTGTGVLSITVPTKRGPTAGEYLVVRMDDDGGQVVCYRLTHFESGTQYHLPTGADGRPAGCDCPHQQYRRPAGCCKHVQALRAALED
jgi:hypothetical protein